MRLKVFFAIPVLTVSVMLAPVVALAQPAGSAAKPGRAAVASADKSAKDKSAKDKDGESKKRQAFTGPNQGMLPSTPTDGPSPEGQAASAGTSVGVVVSGGFSGRTVFGY